MIKRNVHNIDTIVVHHSASNNPDHDDISTIRQWHLEKNYDDVGYHFFIQSTGKVQEGRRLYYVGAHCKGHNQNSIGICLSGNGAFTGNQLLSLHALIEFLMTTHNIRVNKILRHKDLNPKTECLPLDMVHFVKRMQKKYN